MREDLAAHLCHALAARSVEFGLDAEKLTIEPVLNWGGFVNRSFRAGDGRRRVHVKIAPPSERARLRRWHALRDRLTRAYHAPPMLGWIELPETGTGGPIFEWIDGETPDVIEGALLLDMVAMLRRLHSDAALASILAEDGDPVRTCEDVYFETLHERFVEDLAGIEAAPPPFVDDARIAWMREQAAALAERVRRQPAFAEPADAPCHGDLWANNVLLHEGRWTLLDWDGLRLGDPVQDWAMLLGPSRTDLRPISARPWRRYAGEAASEERVLFYARATLLDWIIDPLADWVEAAHEGRHGILIRASNARVHESALGLYRELFDEG